MVLRLFIALPRYNRFKSLFIRVIIQETNEQLENHDQYTNNSGEQTAGLSHTMKVGNSYSERVEEFKYWGTTLTNQNSIQKEIKSRLK